jgi:hypothetical protein
MLACARCRSTARCCTGPPVGRVGVGWRGGEPSIIEGRLPCRSTYGPPRLQGLFSRASLISLRCE